MVLCSVSGCALFRRTQVEVVIVETDSQESEKKEKGERRRGLSVRWPQKWSQCVSEVFVASKEKQKKNIQPASKMQKNTIVIYMYVHIQSGGGPNRGGGDCLSAETDRSGGQAYDLTLARGRGPRSAVQRPDQPITWSLQKPPSGWII